MILQEILEKQYFCFVPLYASLNQSMYKSKLMIVVRYMW